MQWAEIRIDRYVDMWRSSYKSVLKRLARIEDIDIAGVATAIEDVTFTSNPGIAMRYIFHAFSAVD